MGIQDQALLQTAYVWWLEATQWIKPGETKESLATEMVNRLVSNPDSGWSDIMTKDPLFSQGII